MNKTSTPADIYALKQSAWLGLPRNQRYEVWKILLGYIPLNKDDREKAAQEKRQEYREYLDAYFPNLNTDQPVSGKQSSFKAHQMDAVRTFPDLPLIQHKIIQDIMIRVTWIWHTKQPTDLHIQTAVLESVVVPVIVALLEEYIDNINYETFVVPENLEEKLTDDLKLKLEADVYWSFSGVMKLILNNISYLPDDYQKVFAKMEEILEKSDPNLSKGLKEAGVELMHVAYAWVFCFLARDLSLKAVMRLFDAYIADEQGFGMLNYYVCCCVLEKLACGIKKMEFEEIFSTLKSNEIHEWNEEVIETLLEKANAKRELYGDNKI